LGKLERDNKMCFWGQFDGALVVQGGQWAEKYDGFGEEIQSASGILGMLFYELFGCNRMRMKDVLPNGTWNVRTIDVNVYLNILTVGASEE
jgi:hypothetical protein